VNSKRRTGPQQHRRPAARHSTTSSHSHRAVAAVVVARAGSLAAEVEVGLRSLHHRRHNREEAAVRRTGWALAAALHSHTSVEAAARLGLLLGRDRHPS
jgi:hypothetical protein